MGPGKVLPERDSLRISRVGEGSGEAFFSTNFIAGILRVLVLVRFLIGHVSVQGVEWDGCTHYIFDCIFLAPLPAEKQTG